MSEVAVLILTEDSSKSATATVEAVCEHVLRWLVPQFDKQGSWLSFAPANDAARTAMRANRWKSKKSRDQGGVLSLCEAIASHIMRPDGFVFFHFDGDVVPGARSENADEFERVIVGKVRTLVRGKTTSESRAAYVMTKLIAMTPYYSIETWLFANVERVRELGGVGPTLDQWQADLSSLDSTTKPKDFVSGVADHYPTLAHHLKTTSLLELETSFCDTAQRAGACSSLTIRLRRHWPEWVRTEYGLA